MNETTRMVLVLVIICILSAVTLSLTYENTINTIEQRKSDELKSALNEVYPSENFKEIDVPAILLNRNVKRMFQAGDGLVVLIEHPGFQSNIGVLVGADLVKKQITNIKILEHLETPGLGSRIEEPDFLSQFKNKELDQQKFDAITGATISSTAVINAVRSVSVGILKSVTGEEDAITPATIPLEPVAYPANNVDNKQTGGENEKARQEIINSLIEKQKSMQNKSMS